MRRALASIGLLLSVTGARAATAPAEDAWTEGAFDGGEARVRARLLVHPDDRVSGGRVRLGLELEIAPGWHVYDPDPGEAGLPTRVELRAEGARIAPPAWPAPQVLREEGVATRVHSGTLWLPSEAAFDAPAAPPPTAHAVIDLVACRDRCIPAGLALARALDAPGGRDAARTRSLFAEEAGSELPVALDLLGAIGLGLLGGLILNAMPCVLPVLAIKLAWLTELHRLGRRETARHAFAYAAGIEASMLALATATLLLRAGGASVGWGFQLQDPRFVATLAVVTALLAANLLGVYEIGAPGGALARFGAQATGARRSFFDGLLAVALATPCTAPFLGSAVGFALAGSAAQILAVFGAIGAGLALPVLLVAAVPHATRILPRSGPWMQKLRRAAGLLLLATVAWLLFVLGRIAGPGAVWAALLFVSLAALGAHALGFRQRAGGRGRAAAGALAASALLVASVGVVGIERTRPDADDPALPYDAAEVAARVASGHAAFVYFTADWCVTCKVNERLVLDDERVRAALRELDVAVFRADWTRRDEAIRAELARYGRAGVPTYLVVAAGDPTAARVLPELLSVDLLLAALRDAAGS